MAKEPTAKRPKGHVSVIYFHGMGDQRRYEETSRLIDAVDAYSGNQRRDEDNDMGTIRAIEPLMEPHNLKDDKTVTYINSEFGPGPKTPEGYSSEVRYYEVYWAPIMAGASSGRKVAEWILRQSTRPWKTLTTVWRERQRLRRAALANLADRETHWPAGTQPEDFDTLLRAYTNFDRLDVKRDYPKGNFDQFTQFLAAENKGDPAKAARLDTLAKEWLGRYRTTEVRNALGIITILLALVLVAGLLGWLTLQLLTLASGYSLIADSNFLFKDMLGDTPTLSTATGLALSAIMALGLGRFLANYMGDVEAWSTYQETNKKHERRQRVMDVGTDLMKHVLADEDCNRVMIVSHSLGTSVAHDTLLALRRENLATNREDPIDGPIRLDKIHHFVTMASPIDKINYFFESYRSDFHRYAKVIEELRGDISYPPFTRARKPYTHWVNFYDEADVISGSLQSPIGSNTLSNRVDNVHVANLHFPNPGASHSAYFNNRSVISKVFGMTYLNEGNYTTIDYVEGDRGLDYGSVQYGPGQDFGHSHWLLGSAVVVPWLCLIALLLWLLGSTLAAGLTYGIIALVAILVVFSVVKSRQGQREPL